MSGLGSCIAQHAVEGKEWNQHEAYRTRRLMVYGGIIFAPIANRWHAALNLIQLRGRWTSEYFRREHGRRRERNDEEHDQLLQDTSYTSHDAEEQHFIYVP